MLKTILLPTVSMCYLVSLFRFAITLRLFTQTKQSKNRCEITAQVYVAVDITWLMVVCNTQWPDGKCYLNQL